MSMNLPVTPVTPVTDQIQLSKGVLIYICHIVDFIRFYLSLLDLSCHTGEPKIGGVTGVTGVTGDFIHLRFPRTPVTDYPRYAHQPSDTERRFIL